MIPHRPTQALILAAGFGTRLRPLTATTPKPLLPFWSRPIIEHTLHTLARWNVRHILVNLHHGAGPIFDHLRHISLPKNVTLEFSFEPVILGTGGALPKASWFFRDAPFWIVNGDIAFDVSPIPFLNAFNSLRRPMAALWMTDAAGPRTVDVSKGLVTCFKSATPAAPGTFTFCGLHLVSPSILPFIPPSGFSSIIDAYNAAMHNGHRIAAVNVPRSYWADIGTPESYLAAHRATLSARRHNTPGNHLVPPEALRRMTHARRHGVRIKGFAAIGNNVTLSPKTTLCDSILWDNATTSSSATLNHAIVARNVRVSQSTHGMAIPLPDAGLPAIAEAVRTINENSDTTLVLPFPPRGSARSFYRLRMPRRSVIAIEYSLDRPENAFFVSNARLLRRANVPAPRILAHNEQRQVTLTEDAGDLSLLDIVATQPPSTIRHAYEAAIDIALLLHTRGTREALRSHAPLCEPFSPGLYHWERDFLTTHLLKGRHRLLDSSFATAIDELSRIADFLANEALVLVHRDLQSTNILFVRSRPVLIDFQSMRFGPALYDIASLLCDPYVALSESEQLRLLDRYAAGIPPSDRNDLPTRFWRAAVQRLSQALGAYGRLSAMPGTVRFARHIIPALNMLDRALSHLDNVSHTKELVSRLFKLEEKRK